MGLLFGLELSLHKLRRYACWIGESGVLCQVSFSEYLRLEPFSVRVTRIGESALREPFAGLTANVCRNAQSCPSSPTQ